MASGRPSAIESLRAMSAIAWLLFAIFSNPTKCEAAAGDNFGINSARTLAEALDRALAGVQSMQTQFGVDLHNSIEELNKISQGALAEIDKISKDRVAEIKAIVDDTIRQISAVVDKAFDQINQIVQCTGVALTQAISNAVANANLLGFNVNPKTTAQLSPYSQYVSARDDLLSALDKTREDTKAENVMAMYGEIARLAENTQCGFRNTPVGRQLVRDAAFYNGLSLPWFAALQGY